MGMNTKAITDIQRQSDILSDGHQMAIDQAVTATAAIIVMDERMEEIAQGASSVGLRILPRHARQQLSILQDQLRAQSLRALRVCDEVEQIKKNLQII
jgi:glycerol-3-phosphate cytidylyltransferase-like family protein